MMERSEVKKYILNILLIINDEFLAGWLVALRYVALDLLGWL